MPALRNVALAAQDGRRDRSHAAGLIISDRLDDLLLGVHHERAVEHHRLAQRTDSQQQLELLVWSQGSSALLILLAKSAGDLVGYRA